MEDGDFSTQRSSMGTSSEGKISIQNEVRPQIDGPFQGLERVNDNAYKIELPGDYQLSATFNVCDLSPYEFNVDSRMNHVEEGETMRAKVTTTMSSTKGQHKGAS